MTQETTGQKPNPVDPVVEARQQYDLAVSGLTFPGGDTLLSSTLALNNAMLRQAGASSQPLGPVFTRLVAQTEQAAVRARLFEDQSTAEKLDQMGTGYSISAEAFASPVASSSVAAPTQTETLPPMTEAKTSQRPAQQPDQAAETSTPPAAPRRRGRRAQTPPQG